VVTVDTDLDYIQDSPTINLIGKPPPPTHYHSVAVPPIARNTQVPDPVAKGHPVPRSSSPTTTASTQNISFYNSYASYGSSLTDLQESGILKEQPEIAFDFRMFLVAKSSGAARPIVDLSAWTPRYQTSPIRLYSAAEVLVTIDPNSVMVKIDLKSGFFQIPIRPEYYKYYGLYYRQRRLAWTRLLMGHPLAPSIMQRIATGVARAITQRFGVTMVAYLDEWLFFHHTAIPVSSTLHYLENMGFTINRDKSILQPTTSIIYLGQHIDTESTLIQPTRQCMQQLTDLIFIVPEATAQDLQRISGYVSWLASAMGWPAFLATLIPLRVVYWVSRQSQHTLLTHPRLMRPPHRSILLYTDATPTSVAAIVPGNPPRSMV
jgi:hypothetical protein